MGTGKKKVEKNNVIHNVSRINSQIIYIKYNIFIYLSSPQEKTACCYLLIIIYLPVNTYYSSSMNHFS